MKKTCNGGYCQYKVLEGSMQGCTYEGYCDYQTPKDSRPTIPFQQCTCFSSVLCPIHGGGTTR